MPTITACKRLRVIHSLRTEGFQPANQDRRYTRLFGDELLLSNCVEGANWQSDPVIPIVCDEVWHWGCCAAQLTHVFRTESQLVWMRPYFSLLDGLATEAVELWSRDIDQTLMFDMNCWDGFSTEFFNVPEVEHYPMITNHDLIRLWMHERPLFALPPEFETFDHHLRRHVLVSHPLEVDAAVEVIESLQVELAKPAMPQTGSFVPITEVTDEFNTLYFDGDGLQEFITFTAAVPHRLVIGGQYVLMP